MKLGDLPLAEAEAALGSAGLVLAFGPFDIRLKIREPLLARTLHQLYADYPLVPDGSSVLFCEVEVVAERRAADLFRRGFAIFVDGEPHGRSLDVPIALPTLEWTINYIIGTIAHRYFMIHSAVVERDGLALLLPGNPGSGKSTLCAALVGRGWRLLSDEFVLLRPEDGRLVPMPRPISLKNRSIDLIRDVAPGLRFGPVIEGTPKGNVALAAPPVESIRRQGEFARPRWIVFPAWREDAPEAVLEPLSRARAFSEVTDHAINYEISGETGFHAVRRLVEDCAAYRFGFGRLEDALRAVASLAGRDRAAAERDADAPVT